VPRRDYDGPPLDIATFAGDPLTQFGLWFDDALARGVTTPEEMCVSTVSAEGVPSSRMVLLKAWDSRGFVFATNYLSRKGVDIAATGVVALTLRWAAAERQVNVVGRASRTTRAESDVIFAARPRGARLAAWTSQQSAPIDDRIDLERRYAEVERRFAGVDEVPRPPHWGGVHVAPQTVEFWQGRTNRLHDRLLYRRHGRRWVLERLSP
jgi:pyridoxamine 5'-phosphate oxidase